MKTTSHSTAADTMGESDKLGAEVLLDPAFPEY
jgi:hypothetical protein